MMNRLIFLLIATFGLVSCGDAQEKTELNKITSNEVVNKVVSVKEFKKLVDKDGAQIIDVRTPEEYADGNIADAKNLNFYDADFKAMLGDLDKSLPTLVYCRSGNRSGKSAQMMKDLGFIEVYDLDGGYLAWTD